MKRYLFDSNALGDYINLRQGVRERAQEEVAKGNRIGTCVPILAEFQLGIELSQTRERNLQRFQRAKSSLTVWPFTEDGAGRYARIAAELRRRGRPMQIFDMMAAAVALELGNTTVVTTDSDFQDIPGLTVENWAIARENP
jgi:tRNA(fMet)-specific endonuclease VapC